MFEFDDLVKNGDFEQVVQEGRRLLLDARKVGLGVKLIQQLSRASRHREAIELARILYDRFGKSRDLNVLMTAIVAKGDTDEVKEVVKLAKMHHLKADFDYHVQLISTWLNALYSVDENEFYRVYKDICDPTDRESNPFIVGHYFRMLIKKGNYQQLLDEYLKYPDTVKNDEVIIKHRARALVELGRIEEATAALASTRDDRFKRDLLNRISQKRLKIGATVKTEEVQETPAYDETKAGSAGKPTVFIVYGHDTATRSELENALYRIGAQPLIFDSLPKEGSQTVIEILEKHVPAADAIITLLTPDDEGRKKGTNDRLEPRARQNALIEAGFAMISRRSRSLLVALGGVEIPTDFEGVHRIQAPGWTGEVAVRVSQRLRDMGFAVDPSKAI